MSDLDKLPVNEIFETVQGEATFTGTPAIFVRLQGCPVGCPWCDTKHTWVVSRDRMVAPSEMMAKTSDADTFAFMLPNQIVEAVMRDFRARHIVITGGEPCLYDLTEVTDLLLRRGCSVQIETSGTSPIRCAPGTFVTVSPKIDMPGKLKVSRSALQRANEIKMPVGKAPDIAKLADLLEVCEVSGRGKVWLQPLSQSEKATRLCVEAATMNGWRVSIQTHKYLGVR